MVFDARARMETGNVSLRAGEFAGQNATHEPAFPHLDQWNRLTDRRSPHLALRSWLSRGDGVFETLRGEGHGNRSTAIRHWKRLVASCDAMGIAAPRFELFIAAIQGVMDANGMSDARIRVTVTSGDGPLGSDRGHDTPTMTVVASVLKPGR